MSERPNFSDFHRKGAQDVKRAIRNPDGQYEHVGREEDPKLAEAMAYAAKPLIDNALEAVNNGEPNNDFLVTAEGHLTGPPTVTYEHAHDNLDGYVNKRTSGFGELKADVDQAHQAASDVQVKFHDKIAQAKELERQARADL